VTYLAKKPRSIDAVSYSSVWLNLMGGSSDRKMCSSVLTHGPSCCENKLSAVDGVYNPIISVIRFSIVRQAQPRRRTFSSRMRNRGISSNNRSSTI